MIDTVDSQSTSYFSSQGVLNGFNDLSAISSEQIVETTGAEVMKSSYRTLTSYVFEKSAICILEGSHFAPAPIEDMTLSPFE